MKGERQRLQPAGVTTGSRDWVWQLVLALPSVYLLIAVPPLWRDTDGFNQIASTFAPKGIIHWLPGYCFFGRLVVIAAGIVASVCTGHGLPYLSIGTPQLSDAGIYALLVLQHVLLWAALTGLVRTLADGFRWRLALAVALALTPWMYAFANCIGSEAFSNPLVLLVIASGWKCLRAVPLTAKNVAGLFGLLLAACLTRQINLLLAVLLPLACLALALGHTVAGRLPAGALIGSAASVRRPLLPPEAKRRFLHLALFSAVGLTAILGSLGVQRVMCTLFRVPYRSTFGETFEWRLNFLKGMPPPERTRLLGRIAEQLHDPVITDALQKLNASLDRGEPWTDMFLYYAIDETLDRAGLTSLRTRTYQIDLKLNRLARQVILSADPNLLVAIRKDFLRVPFLTQAEMAVAPFASTEWLRAMLGEPRYARLRPLTSFQHSPGFFVARQPPYLYVLNGVPMLAWVALAATAAAVALWRRGWQGAALPAAYCLALVTTGFLIALGTCASTFFGARLHLPVYSLFQAAGFVGLLAAAGRKTREPAEAATGEITKARDAGGVADRLHVE